MRALTLVGLLLTACVGDETDTPNTSLTADEDSSETTPSLSDSAADTDGEPGEETGWLDSDDSDDSGLPPVSPGPDTDASDDTGGTEDTNPGDTQDSDPTDTQESPDTDPPHEEPPPPATRFSRDVRPILEAYNCTSCHSTWMNHDGLVGVNSTRGGCSGQPRVAPGNPDGSTLIRHVSGTSCGRRMPTSGAGLTAAEIATLRAWVSEGAPNN